MIQLIKGYWRGFVGGPSFDQAVNHKFILEDKQLTVTLPNTNLAVVPNKIDISFPYTSACWFDENKKMYEQHTFVRIVTSAWMYVPVISIIPGDEFGMLSCQLRIKQTDKINVFDKQALAVFVIQAYNDFHNGSDGKNTKIRKEITEQSSKMAVPFTAEELEEEITGWIENRGKPPIPPAQMIKFNQNDWVFYQEVRSNSLSRNDYYCLPLNESSFLEVKFDHSVDRSDKHKKWSKAALASQQQIMESIRLTPILDEKNNLLVDNVTKDKA
ncbi:hypothetical protein [Pseudocolwellia sp. HL-MZ7]|uniref:hypothetical protein n=1 Tax=Pseudocolwellia sp. HL-MZ7 TaxID=3400627 RepID=UPI003CEA7E8C